MKIEGELILVKDTQVVTDKFQKREFVVKTDEKYPQTILVELQGQNCDIIDAYKIGQNISVDLNLRGRIWQNPQGEEKYFTTIVAWKVQPLNTASQQSQQPSNSFADTPKNNPQEVPNNNIGNDDEMPF